MLTSYSRVTVVSGQRRVDIALPSALPLAEVLPQVLRFCAPEGSHDRPSELSLAKIGGQPLALSQTLAESGVRDGDVIELRTLSAQSRAAFVEDVRDSLEDAVDAAGGSWSSRSTVTFSVVATSVVLALLLADDARILFGGVAATLLRSGRMSQATMAPVDADALTNALLACAVLTGATWIAARFAAPWSAYVSSAVAALWALVAGADVAVSATGDGYVQLTMGVLAAVLVAGACRAISRRAIPVFVATLSWLVAGVILLIVDQTPLPIAVAVRVLALLAILGVGIMPRLSLAVGGLSSADYRVRNAGRMSEQALSIRFQESSGLLLGALYGVAAIVAVIGVGLAFLPDAWDRAMSLSLAVALLCRSRVFSRIQHMLPLRSAAIAIVLAQAVAEADRVDRLSQWFVSAVAAAGAVAIAVSILALSDITRARIKRLLNAVEFIVVIDLIVVTMGAIGLYSTYAPT